MQRTIMEDGRRQGDPANIKCGRYASVREQLGTTDVPKSVLATVPDTILSMQARKTRRTNVQRADGGTTNRRSSIHLVAPTLEIDGFDHLADK